MRSAPSPLRTAAARVAAVSLLAGLLLVALAMGRTAVALAQEAGAPATNADSRASPAPRSPHDVEPADGEGAPLELWSPADGRTPIIPATRALRPAPEPDDPGAEGRGPVVVELFTSQGCSSCPPADALLAEIAARSDVLALALHVDYWDYIGWRDTFATPAFTERQRAYARVAGHHSIYTPQMIVDGSDQVAGFRPLHLARLVAAHFSARDAVAVRLQRRDATLLVRLQPLSAGSVGAADVQLVRYNPLQSVTIAHGENAGRTISYVNVVTDWRTVATWDGLDRTDLVLPLDGPESAAVIVQQPDAGPILGAAAVQ